jgi:hypothetical protein
VLGFITIFAAGLCGYFRVSILAWPIATAGLMCISFAQHHLTLRRAFDHGSSDLAVDTAMRSALHAAIATGACYWVGYAVRLISGL